MPCSLLPIIYSDSFFFDQAKPVQAKSKRDGKAKTSCAPSSSSDDDDSSSSADSKLQKARAAFKRKANLEKGVVRTIMFENRLPFVSLTLPFPTLPCPLPFLDEIVFQKKIGERSRSHQR